MSNLLIVLVIFLGLLLLPSVWRLTIALWSSIFQIYTLAISGFYPSIALLSTLSLTPNLVRFWRTFLQWPLVILILLMTLQAISLLWSSDRHLGLATILYELPFLILYVTAFNIALNNPLKLCNMIKVYSLLALVLLVLLIIFDLDRPLNLLYLKTSLAKIFINPHTIDWYFSFPGHRIWWGVKPRIFTINPDDAGGYLGICALVFWGMGTYYSIKWLKIMAVLQWLGVFLTYSAAAIGLNIFIPLIIASIVLSKRTFILRIKSRVCIGYFWAGLITLSALTLILKHNFLSYILFKFKTRFILWKAAAVFAPHHLLSGLGFGGWEILYKDYRLDHPDPILSVGLPAHNSFINLWSQSGIFASIVGLMFMLSILWYSMRAYRLFTTANEKIFSLCIMGGFIWVFTQGLGENWGVIGEMHIQPILAVAFGLMIGLYYRKRNDGNPSFA